MEPELRLPENVKRDTLAYRGQLAKFLQGELAPVAFRACRVPMGIYEQRQAGTYMVRIRLGAGQVRAAQLRRIAQLSREHGNGIVHVTTRQDLQIHDVKIERTADVLEGLLEVGLSSRGGGGNTVRNVTACPRAGLCPREIFDVAPHALALAQYLLQFDSSFNLPRKFKIAFSGCPEDCAQACVADLGFFAHRCNGMKGFAVYAGGGLGSNPAVAIQVEEFIEEHEIFEAAEAVKRVFDTYGDRANKHKARLRHVVAKFGAEEFVRLYRKERERIKRQGLDGAVPDWAEVPELPAGKPEKTNGSAPDLLPEKRKGFYTVKLALPLGDIPADDLVRIAQAAETWGTGVVRTTQQQDLLIPSVSRAKLAAVRKELRHLTARTFADGLPKVVACAGASTCKLGLCLSRGLAKAIEDALVREAVSGTEGVTIRISGCPNSCGHHFLGDIGLQGHAKRVNGRLMPCYDVLAGAQRVEGAARLAEPIDTVPAKRIPEFLTRALQSGALGGDRLRALVRQYAEVPAHGIPEDYYRDWGSEAPFSLAGRGPGECGAGVMDVIEVDIRDARQALKHASTAAEQEQGESIYQALLAAARALLVLFGVESKTDAETFAAFRRYLIESAWVEPAAQQLLAEALDWRAGRRQTLADRQRPAQKLIARVEELFLSLDANLKFRVQPVRPVEPAPESEPHVHRVDLRGVPCPLNFVRAKLAMEKIGVGEVLEIELDDGEPIQNVPASLTEQGHEVAEIRSVGTHHLLRAVRKQ